MSEQQRFRYVGYAEGASYLLLLGIAMPLKYLADWPLGVQVLGWIHGVLFVGYIFLALQLGQGSGWPRRRYVYAVAASLLPFGPFVFDRHLADPG